MTIPTSNPHPPKKFTHIHQNKSQSHYLCLKPTTIEEGKEKKKKKNTQPTTTKFGEGDGDNNQRGRWRLKTNKQTKKKN